MVMNVVVRLLAVMRITRLVTEDSITEPVRDRAMSTNSKLGELVQCRACTSVWAALFVTFVGWRWPRLLEMLALSESTILVREKFESYE